MSPKRKKKQSSRPTQRQQRTQRREARAARDEARVAAAQRAGFEALRRYAALPVEQELTLGGALARGMAAKAGNDLEHGADEHLRRVDVVDLLLVGVVDTADEAVFGNARDEWLAALDDAGYGPELDRLVTTAVALTGEFGAGVDSTGLLLALFARLERIGWGRDVLPDDLRPERVLAGGRALTGPQPPRPLPEPVAADRVEGWLAQIDLPPVDQPETIGEALRSGAALLRSSGVDGDVAEPALLAVGLCAVSSGRMVADLQQVVDRTPAWAAGLPAGSPLTRVVDVLLGCAERELSAADTLARVLGMPELDQPQPPAPFHSTFTDATARIAQRAGLPRVDWSDRAVAFGDELTRAVVEAQVAKFVEKFGRMPAGDEPLFFDPDADTPTPFDPERVARASRHLLDRLGAIGVSAAYRFAAARTDFTPDTTQLPEPLASEWDAAIAEYFAEHPGDEDGYHPAADAQKVAMVAVLQVLTDADADPSLGGTVLDRLRKADPDADTPRDAFDWLAFQLVAEAEELADVPEPVRRDAVRRARGWDGPALADRVEALRPDSVNDADLDALVCLFAARLTVGRGRR